MSLFITNYLPNRPYMAKTTKETFSINGEQLLKKVKELIAEGNVRKITIKDKAGKELMSFPGWNLATELMISVCIMIRRRNPLQF